MLILGLESSCDETAAALVTGDRRVLAHKLARQEEAHRPYGGVVPEIAARAHVEAIGPLVEAALAEAGIALSDVDAIAATAGPGLIGGVMVGLVTGKALALAANKPLIAVNHLEGHALSPRLTDPGLAFPYLLLLVSGGHCQLLLVEGVGSYRRLATTIDDAAGEAFDKTAKLLGLGFPGGPAVEEAAKRGDAKAVPLPRPLLGSAEPHFSFAGLKSAVARAAGEAFDKTAKLLGLGFPGGPAVEEAAKRGDARAVPLPRPLLGSAEPHFSFAGLKSAVARAAGDYPADDLAASFQQAVVDCLVDRTRRALQAVEVTALVVAGGVAANHAVRSALESLAADHGLPFVAPPLWLCTDNAAMIAWAGVERFAAGLTDPLDFPARPRWPLDPDAEKVRGAGVKA